MAEQTQAQRIAEATSDPDKLFQAMQAATVRDEFDLVKKHGRQNDPREPKNSLPVYLEAFANAVGRERKISPDIDTTKAEGQAIGAAAGRLAEAYADFEKHSKDGSLTEVEKQDFLTKAREVMKYPQTGALESIESSYQKIQANEKAEKINNVELLPLTEASEGRFVQKINTPEELEKFIHTHRNSLTEAEVSALNDLGGGRSTIGNYSETEITPKHRIRSSEILIIALEGQDTAHLEPKGVLKGTHYLDYNNDRTTFKAHTKLDLTTTGKPLPVESILPSIDLGSPEAGQQVFDALGKPQKPAVEKEAGPLGSIEIPSLKGVEYSGVKSSPAGTSLDVEKQSIAAAQGVSAKTAGIG